MLYKKKMNTYKFIWILCGGDYDNKLGYMNTYSLIEIDSKFNLSISNVKNNNYVYEY
jgi:hypothetical protein